MAARGTLESLGCCATNGSAAVPAAAAIATTLLNVSGGVNEEELASLLQGAEGQLPGPLTSLGGVNAGRGAAVRCDPLAPFAVLLTQSARAASAAAHRAAGAPSYDQYQRCSTCQCTPTPPPRLAELNVNEPRSQTTTLNPSDADVVRRIAWANVGARDVGAREASPHLVLWASSEKASNGRNVFGELGVVDQVRQHLGRAWPTLELMHARLTELSFAQEVRLMRRAAVFISLFGSALHNCHWMRPGRSHCISLYCNTRYEQRTRRSPPAQWLYGSSYTCMLDCCECRRHRHRDPRRDEERLPRLQPLRERVRWDHGLAVGGPHDGRARAAVYEGPRHWGGRLR